MGDAGDDSEDATSSFGNDERVRRLFQACDGDGDGFIDSHDLLNICRELNLENSLDELMRELGADEHGRICYTEFLRRRVALRPEIEAIKSSQPAAPEYLPTSSENSLGEGKMSWEFDSGARDLSPEPHSLQQLIASSTQHPASGNLLELANKLHVAAMESLKAEILDLTNRLQAATQERDHLWKTLHKTSVERRKIEQRLAEDAQLHEEQLTELHSVIAELTRKKLHHLHPAIQEEEVSEADETEAGAETNGSRNIAMGDPDEESDVTSVSAEPDIEEDVEVVGNTCDLAKQLANCQADNAMLQERLNRALQDLETISKLNAKRSCRDAPQPCPEVVRTARVSSPAHLIDRTSPSCIPDRCNPPFAKIAERVRLKKVDDHVTGSDLTAFGVCHTKVAEQLVASVQEDSDVQELSRCDVSRKQQELETERISQRLEHVRSQNTVLSITLDQCREQCERLSLLVGKYESNAVALYLALRSSDAALEVAEALLCLLETELGLVLANCRPPGGEEDNRFLRRASESRRQAERHARELLVRIGHKDSADWTPADESRLRDHLLHLKSERNTCRGTVVELECLHVEPLPGSLPDARKLDLETAVLMQELMNMREERVELKTRVQLLEKERSVHEIRTAAQRTQLHSVVQSVHELQTQISKEEQDGGHRTRAHEKMEELVSALESICRHSEFRQQDSSALVLDLRAANTALVSTLERCKRNYQSRLKRLEAQMTALVDRHSQQIKAMKMKIAALEDCRQQETNI